MYQMEMILGKSPNSLILIGEKCSCSLAQMFSFCLFVYLNTCLNDFSRMLSGPRCVLLSLTSQFLPCCQVINLALSDLLCLLGLFWNLIPTILSWEKNIQQSYTTVNHIGKSKEESGKICHW